MAIRRREGQAGTSRRWGGVCVSWVAGGGRGKQVTVGGGGVSFMASRRGDGPGVRSRRWVVAFNDKKEGGERRKH